MTFNCFAWCVSARRVAVHGSIKSQKCVLSTDRKMYTLLKSPSHLGGSPVQSRVRAGRPFCFLVREHLKGLTVWCECQHDGTDRGTRAARGLCFPIPKSNAASWWGKYSPLAIQFFSSSVSRVCSPTLYRTPCAEDEQAHLLTELKDVLCALIDDLGVPVHVRRRALSRAHTVIDRGTCS